MRLSTKTGLPLYTPLAAGDVTRIDDAAKELLERVGIKLRDERHLEILGKAGARVDHESGRVSFERDWLAHVVGKAPSGFVLCSRDGTRDLHLGEGSVHFSNGGRVFRILDLEKGGYRYSLLRDVAATASLVQQLEYLDFYIIACQAHNVGPEAYHLNDFCHAFNHTTKHVMGGCTNLDGARQMWRIASFIAGGEDKLRERPFVSAITNPLSPLTLESETLDTIEFCVQRGIPVTCAPAPMAGATSPATLAGTLAQMHAEALAGVAVSQVLCPGAKVLYGAVATAMDLRRMELTMGSVESTMMNAAAVQLAKLHGLPIYASAGVSEAKRPNIQAGLEKAFSNLMVGSAGADCVHLAVGMLDSGNSIAYEQFVIDNEVIGMVQRVLSGIEVNEGTLGLDTVEQVGPGGNYVMEDHTIEHMMDEFFYPKLSVRCNFDTWEEQGRPDMLSRAAESATRLLEEARAGLLDPDTIERIREAFPAIIKL